MKEVAKWCEANALWLIIAAIIVAVLILIICIIVAVRKGKKKSAVKKIFKTTDGYLNGYPRIKKPRNVAAVEQRKKDGAVALVKIYSKEGKEEKIGKTFIPDLELNPEEHSALTKTSIVGRQVIVGIKDGDTFRPIYTADLTNTDDKLTSNELRKIRKAVHNDTKQHRKTHKKKMRRWRKGFKK